VNGNIPEPAYGAAARCFSAAQSSSTHPGEGGPNMHTEDTRTAVIEKSPVFLLMDKKRGAY
jgi:hypothetical protein